MKLLGAIGEPMTVATAEPESARRQVERGGAPLRGRLARALLPEVAGLAQGVRALLAWANEPEAHSAEMPRRLLNADPVGHDLSRRARVEGVMSHGQRVAADAGDGTASKHRQIGERLDRRQGHEVDLP